MKLLSIAVPCYNSQDYMAHAIESLLPGGDEVEILIVDDGSTDRTSEIADEYAAKYPGIVRAIHKENGGHGDAVMTGLSHATGLYFKVVDSDDWVDAEAYPKLLNALRGFVDEPIDLFISNFIYDKLGVKHKYVMQYRHILPRDRVFDWSETRRFHKGQYLLMHSVIYRTQMLRDSGMTLPKHTFYVDDLYVYVPLKDVKRLCYLDENFYHYFIGREDQSVQEQTIIRRIDQYIKVNKLMFTSVDLSTIDDPHLYRYMLNFLEIITTISCVMLMKSGTPEHLQMRDELWAFIEQEVPDIYEILHKRLLGRVVRFKTPVGRAFVIFMYKIARKIFGFN